MVLLEIALLVRDLDIVDGRTVAVLSGKHLTVAIVLWDCGSITTISVTGLFDFVKQIKLEEGRTIKEFTNG